MARPRIVSAGSDRTIRIWDLAAGAPLGEPIPAHDSAIWAVTSWTDTAGRAFLASSAEDGAIRVWDAATGQPAGAALAGHDGWVAALISWRGANGVRIASAGFDGTVRVWDPASGAVGAPMAGHAGPVLKLFHWTDGQGGERLVSTSDDGTIRIWDADQMTALGDPLRGDGPGLWGLAGWTNSRGEASVAVGDAAGSIQVWNLEARRAINPPMCGHSGPVGALAAWRMDDRTFLASLGSDGTVRFWDADAGTVAAPPVTGTSGWLPAIAAWVERDGSARIACGTTGGAIRVWDFVTGQDVVAPMSGHTASLWAMTSWRTPEGGFRIAAAGDDAVIRVWNADTGRPDGEPLAAHTAGIWALTSWAEADGSLRLASAGDDGLIRAWNPADGAQPCPAIDGHVGWITDLVAWNDTDGATRLASSGADGTVRIWDPATGQARTPVFRVGGVRLMSLAAARSRNGRWLLAVGEAGGVIRILDAATGAEATTALTGHRASVRGMAGWNEPDGSPRFASASFDSTVRVWDPDDGTCLAVLNGHDGQVSRVVGWAGADGRTMLASAGDDASIRIWDPATGRAAGEPLRGHTAGVWALVTWSAADGRTALASSGEDGTIRLWDPLTGAGIRTIEVGPVRLWGMSDAPSRTDVLNRRTLASAVADQLRSPTDDDAGGPMVVGVEGPWGCGKTTFMRLVENDLRDSAPVAVPAAGKRRRLTIRDAVRLIRSRNKPVAETPTSESGQSVVTAWFNPWTYESGEQVWAGLVHEIIEAAADPLFPDPVARERYWFGKNLPRVDRFALRRLLLRHTVSPILGVALFAVVLPLAAGVAQLNQRFAVAGHSLTTAGISAAVAVGALVAGVLHTLINYFASPVANHVPEEMLNRPVLNGLNAGGPDVVPDPIHRARAGSLYLYQHDIDDLLRDLGRSGRRMVIFIDDLDRCRPATVAEVFEAINVFLAGFAAEDHPTVRFVIGIDPDVVVNYLMARTRNDASADHRVGWSYLRKLIQLPIVLPTADGDDARRFVAQALGTTPAAGATPAFVAPAPVPAPAPVAPPPPRPAAEAVIPPSHTSKVITWRPIEQHPQIHAFLTSRLVDHPGWSIRDAKRLFNVWQLHERLLAAASPITDPDARLERAEHLILLAEIITRWPSLQPSLHNAHPAGRGLQLLASAADDDTAWARTVTEVIGDRAVEPDALPELRRLLRLHPGAAVARLAAEVLS